MYQRLRYRRQFILTLAPIEVFRDWNCINIDQYYLYIHPDLEANRADDSQKSIVLVGNIFDPNEPARKNYDILKNILGQINTIENLFFEIKKYVGSYALIYKDPRRMIILNDALSLREIYYCTKENDVVCGSQPNLMVKFGNPAITPTDDTCVLDFYNNHLKNCSWIGDETYFRGVKHLLPNHYLDITNREVRRYWPTEPIKHLSLDEAVAKSCSFLQGSMKAMVHRHPVMMAVTSGFDSRTLLAASKGLQDRIYFFINDEGLGRSHPDIAVPKKIFEKIRVPFHIHDVPQEVDSEFRQIFLSNTFFATDRILPTIFNVYFKSHSDKVNILGTGEIGRTRLGKQPPNLNAFRIAYKMRYKNSCYVLRQSDKILAELLPVGEEFGINVLTLIFWEQNQGNRWVVGNSESDIAIEEIDPFDSHLLYEILLGVDEKYSKKNASILFKEMIRHMWPELLEWPINPPFTLRDKITWLLDKIGLYDAIWELKYQLSYIHHLLEARKQ